MTSDPATIWFAAVLMVLCLIAAAGGAVAAVWSRSAARKVDALGAIVCQYGPIRAVAHGPPPSITTRPSSPTPVGPPLPLLPQPAEEAEEEDVVTAEDLRLAEAAGLIDRPTMKLPARSGDAAPYTDEEKTRLRAEAEAEAEARSQRRVAGEAASRVANYYKPFVPELNAPPPPPSSATESGEARRLELWRRGQAAELERQRGERVAREKAEQHRKVQPLTDAQAGRPSVELVLDAEGFAPDRASWEGATGIHDAAQVRAAVARALPPPPVPVQRAPRPRPPQHAPDLEKTELSQGVQRADPRAERS